MESDAACLEESAILELLDGALAPSALAGVEAHLASCRDCRALISELARESSGLADTQRPSTSDPYTEGLVIGGRFRLLRLLGTGGTGAVWAAQHLVTRRHVALKLAKGIVGEREQRRFLREARIAGALDHPGIVPIRDAFELDDGTPVLVMDLLDGLSLREHLRKEVRLSPDALVELLAPLLDALESAHARGVTHRDLKPENIFLVDDHGRHKLLVLDFGIAKLATADELSGETTQTGEILGTPFYMAPEQAFGERIDARADVWALGVLVYECLAGERPFVGENLGQVLKAVTTGRYRPLCDVRPEVPAAYGALIDRMLVVDRDRRLASIGEVRAALASPPRRSRVGVWVTVAGALALAAAGWAWRIAHVTHGVVPAVASPIVVVPATRVIADEPAAPVAEPATSEHAKPHRTRPVSPTPQRNDGRLPGGIVGESPF